MTQRIFKNLENAGVRNTQVIPVGGVQGVEFDHGCGQEPHVECIEENGVVHRIEVHCHCGSKISLLCEYDSKVG